ncbi:TetR/AcrR family transcriptional regulator [Paenibacillus sp. GD4]|uniref:TetR/AcrR family transcriptional regulator n=1 Tax=Paenibacillus sp. GD4 TaxID=3068890 RepID=UPI002796C5CB|nr:TetR/AcrR family transcriptional regulator [Paenibacillus sp. GD4]MDQ1912739.1 TetR/AcrR family transcriptional regulator [Paenibacillus sp. GD4]
MVKKTAKASDSSSGNRREEILEAAVQVFSESGYYKTTTAHIAELAGISQPYIFKFFKNKEELFIAALDRAFDRILRSFALAEAPPERLIPRLIEVYEGLMDSHRNEIIMQMQAMVISEEAIRQLVREKLWAIRTAVYERVVAAKLSDPDQVVSVFMSNGMLCNVAAVLQMPELKPAFTLKGTK